MITLVSYAQTDFSALDKLKHTAETVITPDMFELIADIDFDASDEEAKVLDSMLSSLSEIRIYATEDAESSAVLNTFVNALIGKKKMTKLMHVKEESEFFSLHIKKLNDNKVSDLVMLINDGESEAGETVFIVISGNLDMKQIGKLASMMDMPGGERLQEATRDE